MTINNTQSPPTRQDLLQLHIYEHGPAVAKIAGQLDITRGGVYRLLYQADHIPPHRHKAFVAMGIPAELLPPAKFVPTGPKPGSPRQQSLAHAE